ncbi:hypothetical protein SASC598P14_007090 [Snodgrassella alvi SCGC AB-598-P14]|nr:hypothetical protein SASC598P14_007090 [Snodgrassella alvi SCGC AB-598-P14]
MIKKIIVAVLVSTISVSGFAANHLIFSCTNNQGKKVEVKEIGKNIQYSFGRPGNPELVFKNSKTQVAKQTKENPPLNYHEQWIVLKNGEYIYMPRTYIGNPDKNGKIATEAGVSVKRNDKEISSIICDKRKKDLYINFDEDLSGY